MKRGFRSKGFSQSVKRNIALFIIMFAIAFVASVIVLNYDNSIVVGERSSNASLPVVSISSQDIQMGRYFGYCTDMDLGRIRGAIVALDESRQIGISINTHGKTIDYVELQINSRTGERNISNVELLSLKKEGNHLTGDVTLSALIEPDTEYMLIINVSSEGTLAHYYSRILQPVDCNEAGCMEFARYFCQTALSDSYEELATYVEPNSIKKADVSFVNINSTLNDVGWKNFPVSLSSEIYTEFSEITANYTTINVSYEVRREESGQSTFYNVEEYYRMRYGAERVYLLDFERRLTRQLNEASVHMDNGILELGQNAIETDFTTNQTGTLGAFIWGGNLYEYDSIKSVLTNVFSFGNLNSVDERVLYNNRKIRIINVEETGNIDYIVCGYMNTGPHEGSSGIAYYHFDSESGISTELKFINTDLAPEALIADFEGSMYITGDGSAYFGLGDELVRCDRTDNVGEVIAMRRDGATFAMSDSGRYVAICKEQADAAVITDLYSNKSVTIASPDGKKIRAIDFLGEDFVYGTLNEDHYTSENIREYLFPYEQIFISDVSSGTGEVLKTYSREGSYVTSVTKSSSVSLALELSQLNGIAFVPHGNDNIQNVTGARESGIYLDISPYNELNSSRILSYENTLKTAITFKNFDSVVISYNEDAAGSAETYCNKSVTRYYGSLGKNTLCSSEFLPECVKIADANMGFCTDSDGTTVWRYGRGSYRRSIDVNPVSSKGDLVELCLRGCDLEQILSYVYVGMPVNVNKGRANPLIITGYDQNYITVYNSMLGDTNRLLIDDATKSFTIQGNYYTVELIK